jgi:hypothetical protein
MAGPQVVKVRVLGIGALRDTLKDFEKRLRARITKEVAMESAFRFGLGDKVKDRITGMAGIVVSRSEHLFGCERYWVEPQDMKDGKPVEGRWFDQDSLVLVKAGVIAPIRTRVAVAEKPRKVGGPSNQPASTTGPVNR